MADERDKASQRSNVEQILTTQPRPALDEATFQQLLEAAYVLQEHPELLPPDRPGPVETLSEIVETQEMLRTHPYDLPGAANLIAQRLAKITHASGVAIAVIREDHLEYCAGAGSIAGVAGTRMPWDSSLPMEGEPEGAADPGSIPSSLPSTQRCEENSLKSPFLIPIHHEGKVAGVLELRFPDPESITEQDVQSCRLMSGLMSEAITREAELQWKQALAAERATMLGALEKIKPQLERLAVEPTAEVRRVPVQPPEIAEAAAILASAQASAATTDLLCPQCGFAFAGEKDLFCGKCGAPRVVQPWPVDDLQKQLDALWHPPSEDQPIAEAPQEAPPAVRADAPDELASTLPDAAEQPFSEAEPAAESESALVVSNPVAAPAVSDPAAQVPWKSAVKTHKWLQSLEAEGEGRVWLNQHRANIYVGAAVILLLIVLSGWGTPSHSHSPQSKNQLPFSDRLMISLGLAEAPSPPAYNGNPNTQVWVDLHTALYYCPGADLYGKTPGGKFTTQRDAQLDQFEPAARKSCD